MKLFTNTLPFNTARVTGIFQAQDSHFLEPFYLSGGTALALQLGHRESEDLDFFSESTFEPLKISEKLTALGTLEQTELAEGTLNTFFEGVQLQFLEYPYRLLEPLYENWGNIKLSSVIDIACTKLQTISMRGSKKDFVDLHFIFEKYSLVELLDSTKAKYHKIKFNQPHILKSLVYFEDAEQQPMPRMHQDVKWAEVKQKMIATVKTVKFE